MIRSLTSGPKPDLEQLFLEQIAIAQWHADAVGGAVANAQLADTDTKLAAIGLTRDSTKYRAAYEKARSRV